MGDEDEGREGDEESEGNDEGDNEEVECQEVGDSSRPFILPLIWTVNDFYPTISPNVFNKLCDHFQIPESIPIHPSRKHKRCYSRKIVDVGMYNTMFATGQRLPLTELHR